mmetsp:Transcript_8958/g.19299  ORF Transcript_8958/g.19299 Transcript_8958/m.19299 type:complete len:544 (-) Transcript_8958:305-1936(-)
MGDRKMKSSSTLKTKDCRIEGYDVNDESVQGSINGNLEISSRSADCVPSLASSSTEASAKNDLSIRISSPESSTVIQQGTGGNSLGEKRKSSSLNGSSSRHKSSSFPFFWTTPSSRQGQNEEQKAQQQQHQPAIMYLRDLMFKSDLLGPIPNLDKDGKTCKDKYEDDNDNNLMVEDIISERKETELFYDAEEGAICMFSSEDAGNTKGNQDQEGRKRIVRFALDQGSPELIEEDERLLAQSMQGSLCAFDIYNESNGGIYDIEKYGGNCSELNNLYREMYDEKNEACSYECYSDKEEDIENLKTKDIRGMLYSLGGIAAASATVIATKLFTSVRKSKDDNVRGGEVISRGTQNTVDTVHLVESSGMLQNSALSSGASSGASSTSISSSMAASSASSSAASSAGASASSTTASIVSASASAAASSAESSAASLTVSSTVSTVTPTAASSAASTAVSTVASSASSTSLTSTASATLSATSAVSTSVSAGGATQAVVVVTQTALLQSMAISAASTSGAVSAMVGTVTAGAATAAVFGEPNKNCYKL